MEYPIIGVVILVGIIMTDNVMALDIETKNLSNEIGGFHNTHMFIVSTACTYDGSTLKTYADENDIQKEGIIPLSQLKYDLDDHFEKCGILLGHNLRGFDLPVLRDSPSTHIYCIKKYIDSNRYIDTSRLLTKAQKGERFHLDNLVHYNLGESKSLQSVMAPALWKSGDYDIVMDYCAKDTKLVYDLWKFGKSEPVRAFSKTQNKIIEIGVDWLCNSLQEEDLQMEQYARHTMLWI